jgi:hypothetical protein
MKHFPASYGLIISSFAALMFCNSCIYVGALLMSVETKETTDKWRSGKYKTRIQRRAGWAGPYCYYCRVKEKKLGGLYYRKIVNEQIVNGYRMNCILKFTVHKTDTIAVNLCIKETTLIK